MSWGVACLWKFPNGGSIFSDFGHYSHIQVKTFNKGNGLFMLKSSNFDTFAPSALQNMLSHTLDFCAYSFWLCFSQLTLTCKSKHQIHAGSFSHEMDIDPSTPVSAAASGKVPKLQIFSPNVHQSAQSFHHQLRQPRVSSSQLAEVPSQARDTAPLM